MQEKVVGVPLLLPAQADVDDDTGAKPGMQIGPMAAPRSELLHVVGEPLDELDELLLAMHWPLAPVNMPLALQL